MDKFHFGKGVGDLVTSSIWGEEAEKCSPKGLVAMDSKEYAHVLEHMVDKRCWKEATPSDYAQNSRKMDEERIDTGMEHMGVEVEGREEVAQRDEEGVR